MKKKTLIIGGVAGGATTAARLRRRDEEMEIIMFERGEYISYANCGLPYYIGDTIKSRDVLLLQTPEAMKNKYNVDVRTLNEVIEIVPDQKKVVVKKLKTDEIYEESYDNLVIATGSSPIKPNISGIDKKNIFTLWNVHDMDVIKAHIKENKPQSAAVIGGGFIGLEMAENLHNANLNVTLIEMQDQVMAPLDKEMANLLHENMLTNQVDLILNDGVKAFYEKGNKTKIELNSGKEVIVDMVILSIGVKPNSELAAKAKIALNQRNGIIVDEYLKTSIDDIYAVGDVIEVENYITKEKTMVPLAGPANKQARILADNLCGDKKKYRGSKATSIAKVFDLNAASVGINEKQLKVMKKVKNKDYFTALINQKSHAGYYPGATTLTLKMIFDPKGKIYGAQIVGQDGVDKRIDTLATVIRLNGTIYDLMELELSYAPPFSLAKDPVNMLGFVSENILSHKANFIEWDEVDALLANKKDDFIILDVTEEVERMVFAIDDSYHIPLGSLRQRLNELDKSKLIIPYCAVGVRSYNAARILMQNGFERVAILSGGTTFYKSMHYQQRIIKKDDNTTNTDGCNNKPDDGKVKNLDCSGLQCPGPIMKVNAALNEMENNEILKVSASDMGFMADIASWCKKTGNTLLKTQRVNNENIVYIKKGVDVIENKPEAKEGKTLVVFSGDLDKVLASFIIANGAAAMNRPVTMFFTFWGLNALRKSENVKVKKTFIDKLFGSMMPRGSRKLKLSKMNMAGIGTKMMKKVMNDKNVDSLEILMKKAIDNGVRLVACTMSMDIMGITKDELIDGVEFGGVASYLADAEDANVNLFV